MTPFAADLARLVPIGIGATAVMDLWLLLLKRLKAPTLRPGPAGANNTRHLTNRATVLGLWDLTLTAVAGDSCA